jgi:hypothetical protein
VILGVKKPGVAETETFDFKKFAKLWNETPETGMLIPD